MVIYVSLCQAKLGHLILFYNLDTAGRKQLEYKNELCLASFIQNLFSKAFQTGEKFTTAH